MHLESKESIFILNGRCPFKEGIHFRWHSVIADFKRGLWIFETGNGQTITGSSDQIYIQYHLEENDFSNNLTLKDNIHLGRQYKPMVFEMVKN